MTGRDANCNQTQQRCQVGQQEPLFEEDSRSRPSYPPDGAWRAQKVPKGCPLNAARVNHISAGSPHGDFAFAVQLVADRLRATGDETLDLVDRCARTFRCPVARTFEPVGADCEIKALESKSDSAATAGG